MFVFTHIEYGLLGRSVLSEMRANKFHGHSHEIRGLCTFLSTHIISFYMVKYLEFHIIHVAHGFSSGNVKFTQTTYFFMR